MRFLQYFLIATLVHQAATSAEPPEQLIRLPRQLRPDEIASVLAASRTEIDGKTFTFTYIDHQDGMQVLMRGDGWPRLVRREGGIEGGTVTSTGQSTRWSDYFIYIAEYTGQEARRCDGSIVPGELVITYEHSGAADAWAAVAGTTARSARGFPAGVPVGNPVFDVLAGRVAAETDAGTLLIDGRRARGFTAPFSPPPTAYGIQQRRGPVHQTIWIDIDWLLPVRWDVVERGAVRDSRALRYSGLDLQPPAGMKAPRCIR